ncbi:J domain-containing protein [Thermomonas carbonis]|uniref:J domain-containing protein n=1 Tax=Thermomonas carbonis TaxID=1463158 RepID=A0A7G9SN20_9GAMM|nr:J domain-containing protein [Thermomonas carbonis]QNN69245.1 J domain-containing protein [Thermomonas carbonis]GHC05756.1 hypothetical protein GCM10010080_19540 [Thermomonas carbonis]
MSGAPGTALEWALALLRAPGERHALRQSPLPSGIERLLAIAARVEPEEATIETARLLGEPAERLREAAKFYAREVLFHPQADAYRALGVSADASTEQIKANHRLLQLWLHPDRQQNEDDSIFASRVNIAWNRLRNDERRRRYDQDLAAAEREPEFAIAVTQRQVPAWLSHVPQEGVANPWQQRMPVIALVGVCLLLGWLAVRNNERAPDAWGTDVVSPTADYASATDRAVAGSGERVSPEPEAARTAKVAAAQLAAARVAADRRAAAKIAADKAAAENVAAKKIAAAKIEAVRIKEAKVAADKAAAAKAEAARIAAAKVAADKAAADRVAAAKVTAARNAADKLAAQKAAAAKAAAAKAEAARIAAAKVAADKAADRVAAAKVTAARNAAGKLAAQKAAAAKAAAAKAEAARIAAAKVAADKAKADKVVAAKAAADKLAAAKVVADKAALAKAAAAKAEAARIAAAKVAADKTARSKAIAVAPATTEDAPAKAPPSSSSASPAPVASLAPVSTAAVAPNVVRVQQARRVGDTFLQYMATLKRAPPPIWNSPAIMSSADGLRLQLHQLGRARLGPPEWRIGSENAVLTSAYQVDGVAGAGGRGRVKADLVWRADRWMVVGLSVERGK